MAGGVKAIINLARMLLNSERCLSDIKKGCLSDIKKVCQKSPLMATISIIIPFLHY
jgi:hypothetical protein